MSIQTNNKDKIPSYLSLSIAPNEKLRENWESLVGIDDIKEDLIQNMILCLDRKRISAWYEKFYNPSDPLDPKLLELRRETLLVGPSGTGKTTLARGSSDALSRALGKEVYLVEVGEIRSRFVGESSKNVIKVFEKIKEWAKESIVILLLDEFDTLASTRAFEQMNEDVRAMVNTLIKELDKISTLENIYIIASSNLEDHIDIAVKRRSDQIIKFKKPDFKQRMILFSYLLKKFNIDVENIISLSEKTNGYTCADIKKIFITSLKNAIFSDKPLSSDILKASIKKVNPTKDYRTINNKNNPSRR